MIVFLKNEWVYFINVFIISIKTFTILINFLSSLEFHEKGMNVNNCLDLFR